MTRAWGIAAVAIAAAACSSTVTGTGGSSSSSSGGSSSGASSSGASSSSGSSGSSGATCSVQLYSVDRNCEPPFEQHCCAEATTCFNDITCESAAYCRTNCTDQCASCGMDDKGYLAALDACITGHLPSTCWLR